MNLKGVGIVFRKELMDLFRDRKTILVSILIPFLIFPLMYGLMGKSIDNSTKKVEESLKIAIVDKGSSLGNIIKAQKNIMIVPSEDMQKDVLDGKVYLGVEIPENFDDSVKSGETAGIKIIYDDSSQSSMMAMGMIESYINSYTSEVVKQRLTAKGIDEKLLSPVDVKRDVVAKEETGKGSGFGKLMLSLMLPMFLILYSITSPMAAATDLGAGEKERGTLEPLLTTQVGRMSLLFGKFFAITVIGVIGTLSSILGLAVSFKTAPKIFGGEISLTFPPKAYLLIMFFTVLTVMIFGAIELSISIYARSFKEAQTYLSFLSILGIIGGFSTYTMDIKNVSMFYFNIPIVNISIIIKEIISGIYNPLHMGITFIWMLLYITLSTLLARYMFSREKVIFRT